MVRFAGSIPRANKSESEFEHVEAAFGIEDRTWKSVSRGRRVCPMGKFNMKEDKEKLKAMVRSSKDKASAMKRKEPDSTVPKKSSNIKKSKSTHGKVGVEPITKKTLATSSGVDPSLDKGKEIVVMTDDVDRSNSPKVKLRPFFNEVAKALSESAAERSAPDNPDMTQRFRLSFNNAAKVRCINFDTMFLFKLRVKILIFSRCVGTP